MLSQKQLLQLELYCNTFVLGLLGTMLNEKNRGENWKWEDFPKMVADMAEAGVSTVHTQKRTMNEAKREAYRRCLFLAQIILKRAGYIT